MSVSNTNDATTLTNASQEAPKPSFLDKVGKALSVGLKEASIGLEKGIKHVNARVNKDERTSGFYNVFHEFDPMVEPLLASYEACAITNTVLKGRLSFTPHFVCFDATWIDGEWEKRTGVRVVIPHTEIVRLDQAISRSATKEEKTSNPALKDVPVIMPYTQDLAASVPLAHHVLQVFTKDNLVHQFYSIPDAAMAINLAHYIHNNVSRAVSGEVATVPPVNGDFARHGSASDGPPAPQYPSVDEKK